MSVQPDLARRRVLLTRSPDRAAAMATAIRAAGAEPLLAPLIDFEQVPLSVASLRSGHYDWLVVSSITTVRALKAAAGGSLRGVVPAATRVATIGPASRVALEAEGVAVDLAPDGEQSAAGLVQILPVTPGIAGATAWLPQSAAGLVQMLPVVPGIAGARAWLPQSDLAATTLADGFSNAGAAVEATIAYRTVDYPATHRLTQPLAGTTGVAEAALLSLAEARDEIARGRVDAVVAASPSAAQKIAQRLAPLQHTVFIAIGRPTARAAENAGIPVAAIASEPTPTGIVQALAQALPATREYKS